jgi:diaminopimelate epimerase
VKITKMHGLQNDFVVLDEPFSADPSLVEHLCDRRTGVGADGVLAVGRRGDHVTMRYWNADGSEAEMCGNGLRCVARYAVAHGLASGPEMVVDTPVGERRARVGEGVVEVELGPVAVGDAVVIEGREYRRASVGNPHAVTTVEDPDLVDVAGLGRRVETDPQFPAGTNVEFMAITGPDAIRLRVWERGAGETRACGTGMAAAARVARTTLGVSEIEVGVPGGTGRVRFDGEIAWLSGPAEFVFEATWPAPVSEPS